jgi:hypothetical protein
LCTCRKFTNLHINPFFKENTYPFFKENNYLLFYSGIDGIVEFTSLYAENISPYYTIHGKEGNECNRRKFGIFPFSDVG